MEDLEKLKEKLVRELAQSEESAAVHPRREARSLTGTDPGQALLAVAAHAESMRPRFEALVGRYQPNGIKIGRAVGRAFSAIRQLIADRLIDSERSYRGTLLGMRHGLDVMGLLRRVALRTHEPELANLCEQVMSERSALVAGVEQALGYFADHPSKAIRSRGR